jgi:hypothetical protein
MTQQNWVALKLLNNRFDANVAALATREPAIAAQLRSLRPSAVYHIRVDGDRVFLGIGAAGEITPLPQVMTPASAQQTLKALFPHGNYNEPVLVTGEDLGWLCNSLYQMPCKIVTAPGYRPPLFFMIRDLERLWVILHVQDWTTLLADQRLRIFAGENCVAQFETSLIDQVLCRWPKLSVDIDKSIWANGRSFESCYIEALQKQTAQVTQAQADLERIYSLTTQQSVGDLLASGRTLRVLGITSRYTTFIQYSMRDWLAAFEKLGHRTQLLIESADHELPNSLAISLACVDFKPDLVVIIDHYRAELSGLPAKVPVVMWVQDRLPNIFNKDAGPRQERFDYTIGYGMMELTQDFGYPVSRFLPTMMAVNESRFSPSELTSEQRRQFGCDVSFVSNASTSVDELMREIKTNQPPIGVKFLDEVYQQFQAIYDAGDNITSPDSMQALIERTAERLKVNTIIDSALQVFIHKVNNALFRHQAIRWAAELDLNLHLYGKGWEKHPEFARYARGEADNQTQLPIIYQASAINLQVTPFNAVHQRLLDGLAAGGFFLLRATVIDDRELILRGMHAWCCRHGIRSGMEMVARQDAELQQLALRFVQVGGGNPLGRPDYYFAALTECELSGWTRTANTLWPGSEQVTFATRDQLQAQIRHFLTAPQERREIVKSMRQKVLDTHTYTAMNRRLLRFIANDLAVPVAPAVTPSARAA